MKTLVILLLFQFTFSCNIDNPVYSIFLANDAYHDSTLFTEYNPLLSYNDINVRLFDLVPENERCYFTFKKVISSEEPKAFLLNYASSPYFWAQGYVVTIRGTAINKNALVNDFEATVGFLPNSLKPLIEKVNNSFYWGVPGSLRFVGHSLGGVLAHLAGFYFDLPSVGIEVPGLVHLNFAAQKELSSKRKFETYMLNKTRTILSYPNLVNSISKRHNFLVDRMFVKPFSKCPAYEVLEGDMKLGLRSVLAEFIFTDHFHSSQVAVETILEKKGNLNEIFAFNQKQSHFAIFAHQNALPVIMKMFECHKKKGGVESFRQYEEKFLFEMFKVDSGIE